MSSGLPEPSADTTLDLNFRIISCRKLLKGDRNSSDPYVKIMMGKTELHRTKYQLKTLNPVFGTQHDNSFSKQINYGVMKAVGGIGIEVKDWDRIGNDDLIGLATIKPVQLLDFVKSGKPTTIRLDVPPGRKETEGGFITLCVQDVGDSDSSDSDVEETTDEVVASLPNLDFRTSVAESMGEGPPLYDKELMIEIMACRHLIAGDRSGTSDPYVEIKLGDAVLHKTLWIEKTLNPAYSIDHKNIYNLKCSAKALWSKGGLEFVVKDHDMGISALGMTDDDLGYVRVPPQKLYDCNGEYMEFTLKPPRNSQGMTEAGTISIRARETKLEDTDKKAALDVEAVAGIGRDSIMMDDRHQWDTEADFSAIKPKREKLYLEDSDSSSDSSDMYMDSTDDEGPRKKPVSFGAAATTKVDDDSDEEMPGPTNLTEQVTSKWGNQKGMGGKRKGPGGRGGRGGPAMGGRGGRGELYVPSVHPGDMFDQEIEALEQRKPDASDNETASTVSLEPKENMNDMWEQMVEKDEKIKELQLEVDLLKEQNKELRLELKRSRYTRKTNKPPKQKKTNKVPLAKKKQEATNKEEKVEAAPNTKSAMKKSKFSALDSDAPSDDDKVEHPKEEKEAPKAKIGALDFGLDAPSFSSDESGNDEDSDENAPKRGITPVASVVSPAIMAPTRGIPGVRLSEMEAPKLPANVLSPSRGIPAVRMSEIEAETSPKEPASPNKRGVTFDAPFSPGGNTTDGSTDTERSPHRGLLGKMGLTDSVVDRASLYSFMQSRSDDEDTIEGTNDPPDFDRKHKDMQFAKMDFVGIAGSKDKEPLRKINAMPSLAFNPSNILSRDEDSDEDRTKKMVGVSVDKDWDRHSNHSNFEHTTTTVISQTAMQQTKISGRRVFELEQQVQELKEELELALANPGGYEKASLEVQLKVAQDAKEKLAVENERLQKMNKIQKHAMFELSSKQNGLFW
ncbi:unnamed protein product [Cylindrotheca closterium]|uniref:C2 domain-containing protein n=1 Tax=Cylindrotheca closterium TaxID=2856 RepID=A0AAD2CQ21_9STRA|nr:unnamed protein product [Cylindrotheca closterium]